MRLHPGALWHSRPPKLPTALLTHRALPTFGWSVDGRAHTIPARTWTPSSSFEPSRVCQLLKIIKFGSALVPKMELAPSVLARAFPDLLLFGLVFLISMLAFSTLFYVQVIVRRP